MKRVLHLMVTGGTGGIETLAREYCAKSNEENYYMFLYAGGEIAEDIARINGNVTVLGKKSTKVFEIFKDIEKFIRDNSISVVISHHGVDYLWLYLFMIKKKFPAVKTVIYAHSYYADELVKKTPRKLIFKSIFYMAYAKADRLIAISNSVKNGLVDLGIRNPEKIEVIYNGVDTKKFHNEDPGHNDIPVIIYVGRLEKVKGVHKLVAALSQVKENYRCLIIGDGSQKTVLENQVRELGLQDKVSLLGRRSDVSAILHSADIFVHPAIWNEGFGISLVEAMASGLLCIAYKKGAMPEIIDNGVNGVIVEPDTIEMLAQAISDALNKFGISEINAMRQAAIKKADCFNIDNYVVSLDKLVESL